LTKATRRRARPTMYKGVKMRSRLEASFAAALDRDGCKWTYEPHCFADETGQYLPDFLLDCGDGGRYYIEVKPPSISEEELAAALKRMEIIWASEPNAGLALHLWGSGRYYCAAGRFFGWQDMTDISSGPRREADGVP
jgi:hypothetical protein